MLPQGLQRLKKLLKDGRRWLSILERANLGDIKAISDVLDHTYARRGRRRHDILDVRILQCVAFHINLNRA